MSATERFPGIYSIDGMLATLNMAAGKKAYAGEMVRIGGAEYRLWNPYRSKLSAAILNGLWHMAIKEGVSVLYLGAATGTTPSHISDIIGPDGRLYCVELSERNMRQLVKVCEARENMLPILADARMPERYEDIVSVCDVIYQDVSARDQAEILLANSRFLKEHGTAYFIIKSQSIDVSMRPEEVFRRQLEKLKSGFSVAELVKLEPFDKLHLFAVLTKKG